MCCAYHTGAVAVEMTPLPAGAPLGIIAGSGALPSVLLESARTEGREAYVVALQGHAEASLTEGCEHLWCRIGSVGKALDYFRSHGVRDLVLAGHVSRPSLTSLMPDALGRALLARLGGRLLAGDDQLLSRIIAFLEEQGFRIHGAHELCAGLLAPAGMLTRQHPDTQQQSDISKGIAVLEALSAQDVGQAVIVQEGHVLGIEAMEGTAALIERCAALKSQPKGGVLVKRAKIGQEKRADLPTVGMATIEALSAGGYSGLCVSAGSTLMLAREQMIARADALGLFIIAR